MANTTNKTKVITGVNTRLSYFHGWEPVSINGGAEKYSVSVLIPKDDKGTLDAISAAIDAAIEEGIAKFGGKKPNKAAIKLPLRDGDVEREDSAYESRFNAETAKVEELKAVRESRLKRAETLSAFMFEVHEQDRLVEMFNKKLWLATVDTVIVSRDGKLTFKFKNGKEITK